MSRATIADASGDLVKANFKVFLTTFHLENESATSVEK
jgi:hypothetical protein